MRMRSRWLRRGSTRSSLDGSHEQDDYSCGAARPLARLNDGSGAAEGSQSLFPIAGRLDQYHRVGWTGLRHHAVPQRLWRLQWLYGFAKLPATLPRHAASLALPTAAIAELSVRVPARRPRRVRLWLHGRVIAPGRLLPRWRQASW